MIAKTSPMGWNSWDCYGPSVDEKTVRANAEYMAKNLKQYGWEYIVVDIQWSQPTASSHEYVPFADLCMDEYGRLIPAENRFPSSAGGKGFGSENMSRIKMFTPSATKEDIMDFVVETVKIAGGNPCPPIV